MNAPSSRRSTANLAPVLSSAIFRHLLMNVRTGMPRGSGYPTCYKLDLANPELMVTVEVDGTGHWHWKVKAADARKTAFLRGLGWTTFRVSNVEVRRDLQSTTSKLLELIRTLPAAS